MASSDGTDARGATGGLRLRVEGADGRPRTLDFGAISEAEAVRRASSRGLRVLAIEVAAGVASAAPAKGGAAGRFPLLLFSQELLALIDAGLNLNEALSTLYAKEREILARAVLAAVLQGLAEGRNFSDVLAAQPRHFADVYIATVRAAERTGDLAQAMRRYIAYQTQFETIRKKLVAAAIYPAMLLLVGAFVTFFLLGYVVPKFALVYESSGRALPWLSMLLLDFGKLIYGHGVIALALFVALLTSLAWALSRPRGRAWLLGQVLRLPGLSERAEEFRLARFYRALSLLLASGLALSRALTLVGGLLSPAQQTRLTQCRHAIERGQNLSTALLAAGLASPVAESLIKVGERSGQMAEMLERSARFADENFARWVDWASRLLEPVLMTVIGVVVGGVVVLMYLPIFELAGSLQ